MKLRSVILCSCLCCAKMVICSEKPYSYSITSTLLPPTPCHPPSCLHLFRCLHLKNLTFFFFWMFMKNELEFTFAWCTPRGSGLSSQKKSFFFGRPYALSHGKCMKISSGSEFIIFRWLSKEGLECISLYPFFLSKLSQQIKEHLKLRRGFGQTLSADLS